MTYLSYVWRILLSIPGMVAVSIGNMLVLFCFFRPRFKWWLYPILVSLTYLALPIIYKLNLTLFGGATTYSVLFAFLGYWDDFLVLVSFKERFWNMIFLIFTLSILNRLFTFWGYIMYIPLNALLGGHMNISMSIALVITIMYLVISLVCWFVLKDKGSELFQTKLRHHNWVILGSISILAKLIIDFCSNYAFSLNPYTDKSIIWSMIALSNFGLAVLALYLYSTLTTVKHLELKASTDRLIFEKEAQQRYYETLLQNQEEIRRMKHNMNGNLNTLSRLLSENKIDEAINYLAELSDYSKKHQKTLYSNDPYLNAVVTNYASIFAENHINFQHDIQLSKTEMHHLEMCLIMNNALQNALEASLKLPQEQRYVRLQIKTKQSHFLFRITNHFNGELILDNDLPHSTKDGDGHGYGLTSIRNAAESVGGFVICKIEGDMFVLDVAM